MYDEARLSAEPALKEFRDTRLWVQYALGGVAGLGIVGAITLFRKAADAPNLLVAAGGVLVLTLLALAVIYFKCAKPVVLRQTNDGVERIFGDNVQTIRYNELFGLRAKWTDVLRNGIYEHTLVRLALSSQDANVPILEFCSTVSYDTLKYNQLQEFQREIAEIIAERMAEILRDEGIVQWTEKLAIRRDGLEMTKKAGSVSELIDFNRISEWKLDEGLFKLGIDDSRRPVLVEETSQWNFYPGLLLMSQLRQSSSGDLPNGIEEPALIG